MVIGAIVRFKSDIDEERIEWVHVKATQNKDRKRRTKYGKKTWIIGGVAVLAIAGVFLDELEPCKRRQRLIRIEQGNNSGAHSKLCAV